MDELKKCPFCGCKLMLKAHTNLSHWWVCSNINCNAEGPCDIGESGATEKWNTRPIEEAQAAEIERLNKALDEIAVYAPPVQYIERARSKTYVITDWMSGFKMLRDIARAARGKVEG